MSRVEDEFWPDIINLADRGRPLTKHDNKVEASEENMFIDSGCLQPLKYCAQVHHGCLRIARTAQAISQ